MPMMDRYEREDMLGNLLNATKDHPGARKVVTWICDCGCDVAQWYRRTDRGLAFTQQAWPAGVTPTVIVLENRNEVEAFVSGTSSLIRLRGSSDAIEARVKSFEKAVWSAWADA